MEKAFNIKDRINLFEIKKKQIVFNKEPKEFIISKKTMPAKVNKVFKENGNGNDKEKAINNPIRKTVSEEIEHFLFEKPAFPCLLISKDDNGKIEMNMNALNDIEINKIKIRKEDSFEMIKRKNIKNIQMIDYSNFQFDISVIHNKANFQKEIKNTLTTSEKNSLIIGKYKLYSFNISELIFPLNHIL